MLAEAERFNAPIRPLDDEYLTEIELAKFLKRNRRQLRRWHERRIGPPRIVFQKVILYRKSAVQDWLASHEIGAPRSKRAR